MGFFEALDGNLVEARAAAEKNSHWNTTALGLLAGIASRQGDASVTNETLALIRSGNPYALPICWTVYHLVRLEVEEAADWLTRAIEQRDPRVVHHLPYVRTSSQWPKLAKMMNLPLVTG